MGPTWGPSGADRTQVCPMLAPWHLLSGFCYTKISQLMGCLFGGILSISYLWYAIDALYVTPYHIIDRAIAQSNCIRYGLMQKWKLNHDDVTTWKSVPCYWPFVKGNRRSPVVPLTKASGAELRCLLWSAPEQRVEQTDETPVICDAIVLIMTSLLCETQNSLKV